MKKALSVVLLFTMSLVTIPLGGCNAQQTAQKAQAVIGAALQVAQAEASAVPVADQPAYNNFVSLGLTLNGQLGTCLSNISGLMGTSAKVKACFNVFATGLTSPAELAQLRIMSTAGQGKAQLIISSVIAGVNIVLAFTTPVVASVPPSAADYEHLEISFNELTAMKVACVLNEDNVTLTCHDDE